MKSVMPAAVLIALLTLAMGAGATTLRGRLQRNAAGRPVPAGGISVTLSTPAGNRSFSVTTDANGMYFMPDVAAGRYTLEVWTSRSRPPLTVPLTVQGQVQDVPPIVLP